HYAQHPRPTRASARRCASSNRNCAASPSRAAAQNDSAGGAAMNAASPIVAHAVCDQCGIAPCETPTYCETLRKAERAKAPEITQRRDTWPAPDMRLVNDDHASAPAFGDDALPAGWEAWITAEAAARACPHDYVAAGLIGAASAWIGNARRIAATSDWIEPSHLWFALIGAPSAGKTPALRPMIDTSRKLERDAEPAWHDALAKYERDAEVAIPADRMWREDIGRAAKDNGSPPDRPAAAEVPSKPPRPRVIAMDTSTEELQQLLADNPRGLLYVRDELSGWLGSFDRYGGNG